MSAVSVLPGIYWVGAVDWNIRNFHGHTYTTKRGTTYNAYLVVDEKVALIDTVMAEFGDELLANIGSVVPVEDIDYIIANHVEGDHSGALPAILKRSRKAKVLGTARCREGLSKHFFCDWDFQTVKTGDTLSLGKRSLMFLEAPMLHWPDSMFTYCPQEALLFPNDAFGQHYASSGRFDDEVDGGVLLEEAAKYYANILWPLSGLVLKKIDELKRSKIPVAMIAPSHGIIWRRDPERIISAYTSWAMNRTEEKAVIAYETMWGSTARMARLIAQGLIDSGVKVEVFDVAASDRTDIVTQMLDARAFLFGSSTHDNDMLLNIAALMEMVKGLRPKGRLAAAFGSYGWAGGALKEIEGILQEAGIETALPGLAVQYVPSSKEAQACYEFGKDFAARMRKGPKER